MQLILDLDRLGERPLQVQIYEAVRQMILAGSLAAGQKLPSSRSLAEQINVARNTVSHAYERLASEDYIAAKARSGIFVNDRLPETAVLVRNTGAATIETGKRIRLGANPSFTGRAPKLWSERALRPKFDFFVGRPHPSSFPSNFWRRSIARNLQIAHQAQTEYGDPRGIPGLRSTIAAHLRDTRGIDAGAEQIVITSGIQGALNLLARIFLSGRMQPSVAVENPCYQGAAFLFNSYGARLKPIDVDEFGAVVSQLEDFSGNLVYVTPSHQFPTGYTMSLDRRLHLLDWAYRTGSYVIEDDYDSDFRYDGLPLTALAGLDRRGAVIYLGTFSKSIGAGLRLGYAVLPRHLLDQADIVKTLLDNGSPWLEQMVVAEFLKEGAFTRHLRRLRRSYMASRNALVDTIARHFPGSTVSGKECGMHVMWMLPPDLPAAADIHAVALSCDVGLYPLAMAGALEQGNLKRFSDRSLVVGYTALSGTEIETALNRVSRKLNGTD
ncbi:MocR-like pyridoxine biosynthesis transcription factor PdxR [Rhizobium sp. GR12]|uniref:MocR-like pyridoxine biosynthesis transcription factor PdxR n=1 Tax=Rhizobium sp. GR12 TaxID=3053925 RepID=UPI002FBE01E3